MDFPLPQDFDLLKLYSIEFYQLLTRRLNPNGFIALDPGGRFDHSPQFSQEVIQNWNRTVKSTLFYGGFTQIIPFQGVDGFFMAKLPSGEAVQKIWKEFGIQLVELDEKYFKNALVVDRDIVPSKDFVNSVFSPKLFTFQGGGF
jgi:predicted membrane-bound spermidine synthase